MKFTKTQLRIIGKKRAKNAITVIVNVLDSLDALEGDELPLSVQKAREELEFVLEQLEKGFKFQNIYN